MNPRVLILSLIWIAATQQSPATEIDFNRDIRPILSDNCFLCHGPGESTREADLRLDDRDAAIDSGMLVPGQPDQSEVVARIFAEDADLQMPPPDSNKRLTDAQQELIKRWVGQGAAYAKHWAFVAPEKSAGVRGDNPIDHFVAKRLDAAGLSFSPEADPRTLIRRVSFDLTGMPPTPKQVDAFLLDIRSRGVDAAYESLVHRLLASSAYGERMALAWLDAARYGDTSVMHADGPRDMWPWRDWVINAYNRNMPFDQFTIEQLAGDLISDASVDQKIASGFNRNHATSDEGGAFAEELRVEYVVDRVQTTSTVWLGLTMECAQCHDHKYDPISQKEYYQFFAYFNNTADPGMQTRQGNQSPVVEVRDERRQRQLAELDQQIHDRTRGVEQHRKSEEQAFIAWAGSETAKRADQTGEQDIAIGSPSFQFALNESEGDRLKNEVSGSFATLEKGKLLASSRDGNTALKLNGKTQFACSADAPDLEHDRPFSFAAWIKYDGKSGGAVFSRMDVANGYRGVDLWIQGSQVGTHIIHKWQDNAIKVVSQESLKKNQWQHVVITYDGSQKAAGVRIYIDGKRATNKVEADSLTATLATDVPFRIGSRSTGANWKGEVDDIRIYDVALDESQVPLAKDNVIEKILALDASRRTEEQIDALRGFYFSNHDPRAAELAAALADVSKRHTDLAAMKTTSMIMTDNPQDKMRMTYVLDRGQYDAPKQDEAITPGVPAALPPLPGDAPANRLGLARWLTSPDHPLTARVAINRYWTMLFGDGLVRSVSDFGAQGSPPTHPELLDWLAVDFIESGWDIKRMIKQIVMSRTYRQRSRREPNHDVDPQNLLLARSPRFRLQGEFIRDQALAIADLLVDEVGGPGVKPYQPVNIWNEVSLNGGLRYDQDSGGKLYRKSMYTYWKRSAPMPNMLIFDAPTREKCVVQRARTNTPLQALVTLNDPQFVEAARALATRMIRFSTDPKERIDLAFRLATSRPVEQREVALLLEILDEQRRRFRAAPDQADQFLSVGELDRDPSIASVEHAAWTVIAQMILNLDETLTRG